MHAASTWLYAVATCEYSCRDLLERALPQIAGERQHIGLVHESAVLARAAVSELERKPHAPLDTHTRVDGSLRRDFVRRVLAQEPALPRVGAFGVLAYDEEVDGLRFERPQVHVEIEREPHLQQQPALEHARWHIGCPDRAEQDRVLPAQLVEHRVRQHVAGREVAAATEVVVGRIQRDAGRAYDVDGDRGDFGSDAVPADDPDPMGHVCSLVLRPVGGPARKNRPRWRGRLQRTPGRRSLIE